VGWDKERGTTTQVSVREGLWRTGLRKRCGSYQFVLQAEKCKGERDICEEEGGVSKGPRTRFPFRERGL